MGMEIAALMGLFGLSSVFALVGLVLAAWMAWRIVEKAGLPGWAGLGAILLTLTAVGTIVPLVLLWVFAAMALVLSAVGIYGATAYSVTRRTRELAIRIAIGAPAASVFRLVTRYGVTVALVGILAGSVAALGLARGLSSLLYGVAPTDPATVACSAAAVLVVALLACARPAWRATRVDPMAALRAE